MARLSNPQAFNERNQIHALIREKILNFDDDGKQILLTEGEVKDIVLRYLDDGIGELAKDVAQAKEDAMLNVINDKLKNFNKKITAYLDSNLDEIVHNLIEDSMKHIVEDKIFDKMIDRLVEAKLKKLKK